MQTVREAMTNGELKIGNTSHGNNKTIRNAIKVSPFDNGTLVKFYDCGHDMEGRFAHINVSYGMVDVRRTRSKFYHKNDDGMWEGYQRVPTKERIENITKEFTKAKFNPITVVVMPDGVNVIDGQGRSSSVRNLYNKGKIDNYYVPCMILENATDNDCAALFAEQDDNVVRVNTKTKLKALASNNDKDTLEFLERLIKNGLPVYDKETTGVRSDFNAIDTYRTIYNEFKSNNDLTTFDRIISVISGAWVSNEASGYLISDKALQYDIIMAMSEWYRRYRTKIDDKSFVKSLHKYTPQDVLDLIDMYTPKKRSRVKDKKYKYIKALGEIYNGSRKKNIIDY